MFDDLLKNNEFIAVAIPFAAFMLDIIAGKIPDRYVGYIGLFRRMVEFILSRKKNN